MRIGILTISDLGAIGERPDTSGDAIVAWAGDHGYEVVVRSVVPDETDRIAGKLARWADSGEVDVVLTTGGTGLTARDVTPEATLAVADKVMPGFGEQMRQISLNFVPTAILSRQVAVIRGKALIVNLPGQPKSIAQTLEGLPNAQPAVPGIFAAVPYCIDLIGGPYIECDAAVCKAFRPKSAQRPTPA